MSLFEELKRRNVFRVGLAYAISAWILLQVVDLVLENISAPDWVMQVFMLAVAIGFPLALLFAWAFEMTPEGIKLEKDVDRSSSITTQTGQKMNRGIIIALTIAVVLLLVDKFTPEKVEDLGPEVAVATQNVDAQSVEEPTPESTEKSIAVLPFVDMSPDGDQAYFADGISEEILNVLVKTHSLKVAGRTSSFQFRGRNEDLRVIGEQLGVAHILEGSIRKANNRVRITAQLVTANDGFHLWSETYDRELTDIFAIQDEIARSITDALAIELDLGESGQELVSASTTNMDAYDHYLEAKGLIAQRLDFPRAIRLLDEATQLDPRFAEGWAANAQAHTLAIYYIDMDRKDASGLAESMALKALEINPVLSAAHSVLADVYRDRFEWQKATESYLRALELNPDDIEANEQYAQMLWRASYFAEAFEYSTRATELDPLSWLNLTVHATLRYASGDRTGGWSDMARALEMSGGNREFPRRHAVNMSLSEGNIERAIDLMRELADSLESRSKSALTVARYRQIIPLLNSREDTLRFLADHKEESISAGILSTWTMDLFWAAYYGDYALAEKIMNMGATYDEGLGILDTSWFNYPIINPLRNTESYKKMIRNINLDDFWRTNGFPNNCRPIGDDDFACN
jgi:TolB-like protein/Tfp pilus assembly protein PilF